MGYQHSEASLKLMSDASKSRNESEEVLKFKRDVMLGRKLSPDHLEKMAKNNPFRVSIILSNLETGENKEFTSMIQAALFLGVHMTTVKRYLVNNKPYKGYTITKATSSLESDSTSSNLTNSRQPVKLTNSVTGVTKQFSTMKAAYQFLGISHKRLLNLLQNNKSSTNGQINTIKGYIISKLNPVKREGKTIPEGSPRILTDPSGIEVTNIKTNEVTIYSSISSAGEALSIPQASINVYLSRKRTTPYRGIYSF